MKLKSTRPLVFELGGNGFWAQYHKSNELLTRYCLLHRLWSYETVHNLIFNVINPIDPDAEKQLNAFKDSNLGNYFQGLVSVLATDGINTNPLARQLAGLLIKNALKPLHSTEHALQKQYHDQWKALDATVRDSVKGPLLAAMRNTEPGVSHPAAQAAAATPWAPRRGWASK